MATKLNFTSKVRAGMAVERVSAGERLAESDVVGQALRDAAPVVVTDASVESIAPQRIRKIPIGDVVSNPYNPRAFYSAETIDELANSFAQQGQITPIQVTRLPEFPDKYVIVDGERRVRAAKSRGDKFIDADLKDGLDNQKLYLRAYHANKEREEQTVFDDALAWKKLLDDRVYVDQVELGVAVGQDPKHISKVIALTSLPPLALYVHFPWCVRKCPYCDFNSHEWKGERFPEDDYLDALRADLAQALPLVWGRQVHTVFIGGGTPSLMEPETVAALIARAINTRFPTSNPVDKVADPLDDRIIEIHFPPSP